MGELLSPDLTALGVIGLLALALIREVIGPLIQRLKGQDHIEFKDVRVFELLRDLKNQVNKLERELSEQVGYYGVDQVGAKRAEQQTGDMHHWQSPDSHGRQDWRASRVLTKLESHEAVLSEINQSLRHLIKLAERSCNPCSPNPQSRSR